MNILLLGRSGVGKSTFINSFANYVSHQSIENVKRKYDILVPIPSAFVMYDEEGTSHTFELGREKNEDQNESMETRGRSGTMGCKAYNFKFGDVDINLIDTPGLMDTGGIDKDKQNMENILYFLSGFQRVHGICILLKPDEERLDDPFRYCILELFSQLDHTAVENILFVFTKSRSTLYKLGSTGNAIKQMILEIKEKKASLDIKFSKQNYFLFDSESFRYLIAKDVIKFDEDDTNSFLDSWVRSRKECIRMINYIRKLEPYDVGATLSIYRARQLITTLQPHMRAITENIINNESHIQDKQDEINSFKGSISELREILYIPQTTLVTEHFDNPRIICASMKCAKELVINGLKETHYPQKCYESPSPIRELFWKQVLANSGNIIATLETATPSQSETATQDKPPDLSSMMRSVLSLGLCASVDLVLAGATGFTATTGLMGVAGLLVAGSWYCGFCNTCGCKNSCHFGSYYETKQIEGRIEDDETKQKLDEVGKEVNAKESFLCRLEEALNSLKFEKQVIDRANGLFVVFLKHRAITPYNDAFPGYLNLLIERAKQENESEKKVANLEQQLADYEKLKDAIDEGQHVGSAIQPEEIENMIQELTHLPRYGEMLKVAIEKKERVDNFFQVSVKNTVVTKDTTWADIDCIF